MLSSHADYRALGRNERTRHQVYRALFRHQLEPGLVDEIRDTTIGNYALGNERFRKQVEASLQRRATRGRSGRPPKSNDVESGTSL